MSTVKLEELADYIQPSVPSMLMAGLLPAARSALIEFCKESRAWWTTLADIAVDSSTNLYTLAPPAESVVVDVLKALWDGSPIDPYALAWLDAAFPGWETQTATDPTGVFLPNPRQVQVVPALSTGESGLLGLRVALKPALTSLVMEDWLFEDYHLVLAAGAKADLLEDQEPRRSAAERAKFKAGIQDARMRVERGGVNRTMVAYTYPFG